MTEIIIAKYMKELDTNEINNLEIIFVEVKQIILLNPNMYTALILRGRLYARKKLYKEAYEDVSQSILINPKNDDGYFFRAQILEQLGKTQDAITDYSKAIGINKNTTKAYFQRGNLFYELKQYQNAINDYTKIIELDPEDVSAYKNRGNVFKQLNKLHDAISDYTKVIELEPKYTIAYINRGYAFEQLNKLDEAIDDFTKVIELGQKSAIAYYNRGCAFQSKNQLDDAITDFTKTIELDQKYTSAFKNRGYAFEQLNQLDDAIRDYSKAIELDPTLAYAYYYRGNAFYQQTKFDDSIRDYETALELQPNNPFFFQLLDNIIFFLISLNQLKYILYKHKTFQRILTNKSHMKYIEQTIKLLSQMVTMLDKFLTIQHLKKKQNRQNQSNEEKRLEGIENQLELLHLKIKSNGQDFLNLPKQVNIHQSNVEKRLEAIENLFELLKKFFEKNEQNLNQSYQSESNYIDTRYKNLSSPENQNQRYYYHSFPSHINIVINIYFNRHWLFQSQYQQSDETITEKGFDSINQMVKIVAPEFGAVPIVGSILQIFFRIFNYGIKQYQEKKLNQQISNIVGVIYCKGGTLLQREKEFQLATFTKMDQITQEDFKITDLEYYDQVQNIIAVEQQKIPYAKNEYWQLGVYHCMIVLKYIEKECQQLIANEKIELREFILLGMKMWQKKNVAEKQKKKKCPKCPKCGSCEIQ